MSIKEAKIIIDEYGLNTDEETIEIVLDLINKFGSARNILIEGLKPEYKFLKKLSKLLAMSGIKKTFDTDTDAEDIANLIHSIYKTVLKDSEESGQKFSDLLRRINVRETFKPNEMQLWVMQNLGGREFISKINYQDPNNLHRMIAKSIESYKKLQEFPEPFKIENKT